MMTGAWSIGSDDPLHNHTLTFIASEQNMQDARIKVKSNNPDDDFWIDETMDFEVFGRVIKVWTGVEV